MTTGTSRRVVIGIGNPDRGDDAAGRAAARLLRGSLPHDVDIVEHDGEATGLLARLDGATAAYLVDACRSGAAPGTVRRFDATAVPLPQGLFEVSTHGFGVAAAIELARALGRLPDRCIIYAIEGGSFSAGAPLSAPVAQAVTDVAARLHGEIAGRSAPLRADP